MVRHVEVIDLAQNVSFFLSLVLNYDLNLRVWKYIGVILAVAFPRHLPHDGHNGVVAEHEKGTLFTSHCMTSTAL